MGKRAAGIVPHQLNFCAGLRGTAAGPREAVFQTVRQAKARTVGDMHPGKGRKEALITHGVTPVQFGERGPDHLLQKGQRPGIQALMNRFRRHLHPLAQLRHFGRQLGKRGLSLTPVPEGH
jgi:hypothetical protein